MKEGITTAVAVGIDVGDRSSQVCAKDAGGAVVWEKKVRTTEAGFRGALGKVPSITTFAKFTPKGWKPMQTF